MSFFHKKRKKASEAAPIPKHPGEYAQDCNQSLLKDGRYDPTRVSSHENDVVKEVILASRKKYSRPYQGIGLAVETYSVIYKPRYILYEYIVQKYGHSSSVFDVLATAIAYKEKGAAYRRLSLQYFQLFFQSASSADIAKLPRSYPLWSIYNMMSDLYESTYDLESALDYAKKAAAEKRRLNFISPYIIINIITSMQYGFSASALTNLAILIIAFVLSQKSSGGTVFDTKDTSSEAAKVQAQAEKQTSIYDEQLRDGILTQEECDQIMKSNK